MLARFPRAQGIRPAGPSPAAGREPAQDGSTRRPLGWRGPTPRRPPPGRSAPGRSAPSRVGGSGPRRRSRGRRVRASARSSRPSSRSPRSGRPGGRRRRGRRRCDAGAGRAGGPTATSQNRAVASRLAVNRVFPSGLKATAATSPALPRTSWRSRPLVRSQGAPCRRGSRCDRRGAGVEGDGRDRVGVVRRRVAVEPRLRVACHVPEPRIAVPTTEQEGPAVGAERGLLEREAERPDQGAGLPQRFDLPERGGPGPGAPGQEPSGIGAEDQSHQGVGLPGRLAEERTRLGVRERDPGPLSPRDAPTHLGQGSAVRAHRGHLESRRPDGRASGRRPARERRVPWYPARPAGPRPTSGPPGFRPPAGGGRRG